MTPGYRNVILARRSIAIWPKAVLAMKHLFKPERRLPKGAAATSKKRGPIDCSPLFAQHPSPNELQAGISIGDSSGKNFNLIMKTQIKTKNNIPTRQDIIYSSINFVVQNIKSSSLSKNDFISLLSEFWDKDKVECWWSNLPPSLSSSRFQALHCL